MTSLISSKMIEDFELATKGLKVSTNNIISNGILKIDPSFSVLILNTEGASALDELTNIVDMNGNEITSNPTYRILLATSSSSRDVLIKHNNTSNSTAGIILCEAAKDILLNSANQYVELIKWSATQWVARRFNIPSGTSNDVKEIQSHERAKLDLGSPLRTMEYFNAVGSGNETSAISAAITYFESTGQKVDGLGKSYITTIKPKSLSFLVNGRIIFENVSYEHNKIFSKCDTAIYQVTNSPDYNAWPQNGCDVRRDGEIWVKYMEATGHLVANQKMKVQISHSQGSRYDETIDMYEEFVPNMVANSMAAGFVKGSYRYAQVIERRDFSASDPTVITELLMMDRNTSWSAYVENKFSTVNNSPNVTITFPGHGFVAGDICSFSSVTSSNPDHLSALAGLSSHRTVVSVIDGNTFVVNKGSNSTGTYNNIGSGYIGCVWESQTRNDRPDLIGTKGWRITTMPIYTNVAGAGVTHVHSMATNNMQTGLFSFAYHVGGTVAAPGRAAGLYEISNFWTIPVFTKREIPFADLNSMAEPSHQYLDIGGGVKRVFISFRSQGMAVPPKLFWANATAGAADWVFYNSPFRQKDSITGSLINVAPYGEPTPFHFMTSADHPSISGVELWHFTVERGEGEWNTGVVNRLNRPNYPRIRVIKIKLNSSFEPDMNLTEVAQAGQAINMGEYVSTGLGVGSVVKYTGPDNKFRKLMYFYGSERLSTITRMFYNTPSTADPFKTPVGYQPDIHCLEVKFEDLLDDASESLLRGQDNRQLSVYYDNIERKHIRDPLLIDKAVLNGSVNLINSGAINIVGGVLTIPEGYSGIIQMDTAGSAMVNLNTITWGGG